MNNSTIKIAIIGGGPAGLSSAIALAKKGHQIDLYEKQTFPVDKVCGEGMMPNGLECLDELGVRHLLRPSVSHNFEGIKYITETGKTCIGKFPQEAGKGIRRTHLSESLWARCNDFDNISLKDRTSVGGVELQEQSVKVNGNHYDKIVVADGLNSKIKKQFDLLKVDSKKTKRMGARVHLAHRPWSNFVEVYWGKKSEAYVTPVGDNLIEIAFIWETSVDDISKPTHFEGLISRFPHLEQKLESKHFCSRFNIVGPLNRGMKKPPQHISDRILFVGDAMGFIDGITGEGVSLALEQAVLLPEVLNDKDAQEKLLKVHETYAALTAVALFFSRHKNVRNFVVTLLKTFPFMFNMLLVLNMGKGPSFLRRPLKMLGRFFLSYKEQSSYRQHDQKSFHPSSSL